MALALCVCGESDACDGLDGTFPLQALLVKVFEARLPVEKKGLVHEEVNNSQRMFEVLRVCIVIG
jgi:hypothetical protein